MLNNCLKTKDEIKWAGGFNKSIYQFPKIFTYRENEWEF